MKDNFRTLALQYQNKSFNLNYSHSMKKTLLITAISFLIFSFSSCKKDEPIVPKPKAEFTFIVGANGKVLFQNVSTDADDFTWNLGDGVTNESPDYFTHQYVQNRTWQVSLTAKGKGGSDIIVKTVYINNVLGNLMIYKKFSSRNRNINVYIDGNFVGAVDGSYYYSTSPSCGNSYSVTVNNLKPGKHKIEAKETGTSPYSWSTDFEVTGGVCNTFGLTI